MKSWLEPERARLEALRSLQVDAATWGRNGRDAGFLNHRNKRLADATELIGTERYRARLGGLEFDYVAGCAEAERLAHGRTRRVQALLGALIVLLALGGAGWSMEDFLREQYYWRVRMGPSVLRADQEKEKAANPGSEFRECTTGCPTMVVLRAGEFMMGSPDTEEGHRQVEGPQHAVSIAKSFAVSKYEITFEEWDICAASRGCPAGVGDEGFGRGMRPVINVNWNEAQQFVAGLSRVTGQHYRLLSEAEWEYAARAGTTTRYSFGDDEAALGQYPWYRANGGRLTHRVGERKANAFGLYDMEGNVWEWCEDRWHPNYQGAPNDGSEWRGGDERRRILRGGSWDYGPESLRSAYRDKATDFMYRSSDYGFRVARALGS
jgi:formylglycine-generating enzyme required for sulfatase activity